MTHHKVQAKVLRQSAKGPPNLNQFGFGEVSRFVQRCQLGLQVVRPAQRQQRLVVLGREGTAFA
jgi:hypothetical protein